MDGPTPTGQPWAVNNDNHEFFGNHFDGSSAGAGLYRTFTMEQDGPDPLPTTGTYYVNAVVDIYFNNMSLGIWNHTMNVSIGPEYRAASIPPPGWGWVFGPNEDLHSDLIFDVTKPTFISTAVNMDADFPIDYSFTANQPSTGANLANGPMPNHLTGFGTPRVRFLLDRHGVHSKGVVEDADVDQIVVSNFPILSSYPSRLRSRYWDSVVF